MDASGAKKKQIQEILLDAWNDLTISPLYFGGESEQGLVKILQEGFCLIAIVGQEVQLSKVDWIKKGGNLKMIYESAECLSRQEYNNFLSEIISGFKFSKIEPEFVVIDQPDELGSSTGFSYQINDYIHLVWEPESGERYLEER